MARQFNPIFKICAAYFAFALAACGSRGTGGDARMKLSFPSVNQLRGLAKSSLTNYDFTRACFAVNITAGDIPPAASAACGIPTGIFQGFVAPGASLTLTVPHGKSRQLEVIAYQRASSGDPCPSERSGTQGLNMARLARVGLVPSFDALDAEVTIDVKLQAPDSGITLASQYGLPGVCQAPLAPTGGTAKIVLGRAVQTSGKFTIVGSVSGTQNEVQLQGGAFRLRMSRRAQ